MGIIITGAAGYIGSIVTEELLRDGFSVIAVDNLQQGHREAIASEAMFVKADLADTEKLGEVFKNYQIEAVVHLAAESLVSESITNPQKYFRANIINGMNLLEAMLQYGVQNIIFSSSAAVYGEPQHIPIEEEHPQIPINPYGESKLIFEHILDWYGRAYGIKHISLRYFNAAGSSNNYGEDHYPETHLIPNVLRAALKGNPVSIFGTDYPTKDGSCVRDYIHVIDIALAHIRALKKLGTLEASGIENSSSHESGSVYNIGNGAGFSVLEVVDATRQITNIDIPLDFQSRRPGDPAVLVASSNRATEELGWKPRFPEIEAIIESAWRWMKKHPEGYSE